MAIRTVFTMVADCARGDRQGWLEFVRDFAGIARSLLSHYFPGLLPSLDEHVIAVLRRAGAEDGAWFAGLSFSNEREFMVAFRDLVFAYGRENERLRSETAKSAQADQPGAPIPLTLDQLRAVTRGLMLLEREMLWLFIKGYNAERVASIMMNAAASAESVYRAAGERLQASFPGAAPENLVQSAPALMEAAEQSKTDACTSLKTFNNLVNGQITWRERESAERHMNDCFYCIDRFTTFQEMVRLRKDTPPLPPEQVETILAQLPLAAAKPRGTLSRLFAGH